MLESKRSIRPSLKSLRLHLLSALDTNNITHKYLETIESHLYNIMFIQVPNIARNISSNIHIVHTSIRNE